MDDGGRIRQLEEKLIELERQLSAKEKICRVLSRRVERSVDSVGGAYSIFERNILLQNLVDQRSGEIEETNKRLSQEIAERIRSERRLHRFIQGSPIPTFVIGTDHRTVYWNKSMEELTGIRAEDVLGTTQHWKAFYKKERPCMADLIADGAIGHLPVWYGDKYAESKLIDEAVEGTDFFPDLGDGGRWLRFTAAAIRDTPGGLLGVIETIEDITESRNANEKLKRGERFLSSIFASIQDGIFVLDRDQNIVQMNPTMERWYSHAMPATGKTCYKALRGHDNPCPGCPALVAASMQTAAHGAIPRIDSSGTASGWLEVFSFPLLDLETGSVTGTIQYVRDITLRKKAEEEKEKLEAELLQARKMEAIGTLAGGIAHDFNNLLMGIQGFTSLIGLDMDKAHPHYDKLRRIDELVNSGADLTRQLLGFARGGKYEIQPADLNEVVARTSGMFARTRKEITTHHGYQEDVWPVELDRGQIERVLLNLYVNAAQAMPEGGNLYLETRNVTLDASYAKSYSVPPGDYVMVSVTDTGIGMDSKTRERIFEPFFTTKMMGRGTGLGLATVYGIVKGHKGVINVYSEVGKGTTFRLYFPASGKAVKRQEEASEEPLRGCEAILLVDDESIIIDVTRDILESLGYRVFVAASGAEALRIYETDREIIDLVILDMIMPGMGGEETFDRLKANHPGIKIILSSGYSLNGQASRILQKGCTSFLQKPFGIVELSKKIREVLAS